MSDFGVLLPGLDGSGRFFSSFLQQLPASFRTQVLSYPPDGCGSYEELVAYILPQLPIDQDYCLIAESFSVPVALEIARQAPDRLKRGVIVAGFCFSPLPNLLRSIARSSLFLLRFPLPSWLLNFVLCNGQAPALSREVKKCLKAMPHTIVKQRIQAALEVDLRGGLDEIEIPFLALMAKDDRLLHPSCGATLAKFHEKLQLSYLEGPHFLLQCKPQQSSAIIMNFLKAGR